MEGICRAKQDMREELQRQVDEYLARGGEISQVPAGVVACKHGTPKDWDRKRMRGVEAMNDR